MTTTLVPLDKLELSPFNVRQNPGADEDITMLAMSIRHHGLINPLTVTNSGDTYAVVAGGRRLAALRQLQAEGEPIAKVPVKIITQDEAKEVSLAENYVRSAMTNIEIYEAVKSLGLEAPTAGLLAERFGLPMDRARRIARLAHLHPTIFEAWKAGEINEDHARAYAATTDHAKQLAVFNELQELAQWERSASAIRRKLGFGDYDHAKLLREVGREAYLTAGGMLEIDLFGDNEKVLNVDLLVQLADNKRRTEAEAVIARCNRPLEILSESMGYADQLYRGEIEYLWPDDETEQTHNEITEAMEAFDSDQFDNEDEAHEAWEELEQRLDCVNGTRNIYLPEGGRIGLFMQNGQPYFFWIERPTSEDQPDAQPSDNAQNNSTALSGRATTELAAMRRQRLIERSAASKTMGEQALCMMLFTMARFQHTHGPSIYDADGIRSLVTPTTPSFAGADWLKEPDATKAFAAFKNAYNSKAKVGQLAAEMLASMTLPKLADANAPHIDWLASTSQPLPWQSSEEFWSLWRKGQMLELVREFDPEQEIVTRITGTTQAEMRRLLHGLFVDPDMKAWKGLSETTRAAVASWVPAWLRFADEEGAA